jgi:pteridine reductase
MSIPSTQDRSLQNKTVLVTGGARRIGRIIALTAAELGARVIIHHAHSPHEAEAVKAEIIHAGGEAEILTADFLHPEESVALVRQAFNFGPLYAVVNNAAIFKSLRLENTSYADWQEHLGINLTVPFLMSQEYARLLPLSETGVIINLLDWRALRPSADHFPYTISKAGLAALTKSLAVALAPRIRVNGLALGAILPPANEQISRQIIEPVPMQRWAEPEEVVSIVKFLLTAPAYITGEIIHLDGGRHLV